MKRLLMLFLLLLPALAFAQQQTTVNGSQHPELIPDSAAAMAVFSVHSMYKNPTDIANTEKHHAKIGFNTVDHAIYDSAMQAYFNAVMSHNPSAMTATASNLNLTLSADGQTKLKAFIQREKARMQYHIQPAIPQEGN